MHKTKPNHEIEIKLRVADPQELRLRLKRLRAEEIIPRTFESNTLYDTTSRDLKRRGQIIRIRIERSVSGGHQNRREPTSGVLLTYKGPAPSLGAPKRSRSKETDRRRFKIMDEVEVTADRGERMSRILGALGLGPVFRYEKYRTTYAIPGIRGLKIEFDETPIGLFLELEGDPASIDRAARLLGYSRSDYLTDSYGALYLAECRRTKRRPSDMLFRATKKLR
jgi:adenylate cyclase class 2